MELKPIHYKKAYDDLIAKEIIKWQNENIYKPILGILKDNVVLNNLNILAEAIKNGLIFYQNDGFYTSRGRFSNQVAQELKKIGAKYSKTRNAYLIQSKDIPIGLTSVIDTLKAQTAGKALLVKKFINSFIADFGKYEKQLVFDTAVETIMKDLQNRFYKNFQEKKIATISPKFSDFRASEIAKNYTNNLKFWIQKWQPEQMIKMREIVGQMAIDGKSQKAIAEEIQKIKNVDKRKALFLARNETAIATSSYLQAKYKEEGLTHYKWRTNLDGRERELHKELNGKIFKFDEPPIIYDYKGKQQRGNPGETFNCRCLMQPIIDKNFVERRRKLYVEIIRKKKTQYNS